MKLVTYVRDNQLHVGGVVADTVVDLTSVAPDMLGLISMGASGLDHARRLIDATPEGLPLSSVRLTAPIPQLRRNVMCLGLNYAAHVEESHSARGQAVTLPEFPVVFTKATSTVNGPFDNIPYDASVSESIDWEVELGVVVGPGGRNITREAAMNHVYGYMVLNDITARDLQRQHKQFFKGKSLDGSCPMGPWIITADEVPDPHNLAIRSRVNGELKQDGHTSHMIFTIPEMIRHLSRGMTLFAGDIVATGTPSGVGFARTPPEFLRPGDVVECEVEGVGTIRNQIG